MLSAGLGLFSYGAVVDIRKSGRRADLVNLVLALAFPLANLEGRGEVDIFENAQNRGLTAGLGQIRAVKSGGAGRCGFGFSAVAVVVEFNFYFYLFSGGGGKTGIVCWGSSGLRLARIRVGRRQTTTRACARVGARG